MTIIRRDLTRPSTTITTVGLAGACTTLIIGICTRAGIVLSAEEAAALVTVAGTVLGYFVRERVLGQPPPEPDEHEAGGP